MAGAYKYQKIATFTFKNRDKMRKYNINILSLLLTVVVMAGCTKDEPLRFPDDPSDKPSTDVTLCNPDYPNTEWAAGTLDRVFNMSALPEIHVEVSVEQWNELLKEYDRDSNTSAYIHCDVEYKDRSETYNFTDAGLRLRGNTSRRRPEGNGGEMHTANNTDWRHCHFMINLRKYQKDDEH